MGKLVWTLAAIVCFSAAMARADFTAPALTLQPDDTSVYAPPTPPREDEGLNLGGGNLDLDVRYSDAYVYRGINHNDVGNQQYAPNLQFDGNFEFNLGKLPHPFVGVFANIFDSDPVSRFQEIRPYFGLEWNLRPIILAGGHTTYIYPEREGFNSAEVWGKITLDDSFFFHSDQPFLSPYIYAGYDYDKNHGWYFEAGVHHDFIIEDTGLTITAMADVAYAHHIHEQFVFTFPEESGFQHYDVGLIGNYSLNSLLNFSERYGKWSVNGFMYYTSGFANSLQADRLLWGGVGISFKY